MAVKVEEKKSAELDPVMTDFDNLAQIDSDTELLINLESERQQRKLIMIPSESICPPPVRKALSSCFTNLYAEGYPPLKMTQEEEEEILDMGKSFASMRRYSDRRYYKGCDFINIIEALCQVRVAKLFATPEIPAKNIFANVQPLSGAAANNAVYEAFVDPGETVMGMSLTHGGHLTHGSELNRSGKRYRIFSYSVDPKTERLNYDEIMKLALEYKPRMIIAGYSSYPWSIDWKAFRAIADAVGAVLLADIAHPAGLVVAGKFPNPVGIAHVTSFTTHKTICGPRGAVILTTDEDYAKKIDNAVFPGEQGGPHINNIAAKAVAFKIASTPYFKNLMEKIVENASALADELKSLGLKLAYNGTDTHMLLVDLNHIKTESGYPLKGEVAARILDLCGIVCNKNTIPGDTSAADASAIRLGTTWLTQRNMGKPEMKEIARLIHRVITSIKTFSYKETRGDVPRGKIKFEILEDTRKKVEELTDKFRYEKIQSKHDYPYFYFAPEEKKDRSLGLYTKGTGRPEKELETALKSAVLIDTTNLDLTLLRGERAEYFLQEAVTGNVITLQENQGVETLVLNEAGNIVDNITILPLPDAKNMKRYVIVSNPSNTAKLRTWLSALSDGYVIFNKNDIYAKIEGPVTLADLKKRTCITLSGKSAKEILKKIFSLDPETPGRKEFQINGENYSLFLRTPEDSMPEAIILGDEASIKNIWSYILEKGKNMGVIPASSAVRDLLRRKRCPGDLADCFFEKKKTFFIAHTKFLEGIKSPGKKEFKWEAVEAEPKKSCLYEEHKKLSKKIINFAGWMMPVWYTGIQEEHQAVRKNAGLFDVSHMGVFEISGKGAERFLDIALSNYIPSLETGHCLYSYMLDPKGDVIDDVLTYRLSAGRFMMVVNAANKEKDMAWLQGIASGEFLIDCDFPFKEMETAVSIRDMKDPETKGEKRADLCIQGPASRNILLKVLDKNEDKEKLQKLAKNEFYNAVLKGKNVYISRTGYTGEDVGYELYVNPDDAPFIWNTLLEAGKEDGLIPAGLGARDSTRTEAGLPLYGHELAGKFNITPFEAGYGGFAKLHKPYFIGKKALIEKESLRNRTIVRFRILEKGIRVVRPRNQVVNLKGEYIGEVTSCVPVEGTQIGMAFIDKAYASVGGKIGIFIVSERDEKLQEKPKSKLTFGDKVMIPEEAVILTRFTTFK